MWEQHKQHVGEVVVDGGKKMKEHMHNNTLRVWGSKTYVPQ